MIRQFRPEDAAECCTLIRACIEYDLELPATLREQMLSAESPESMLERACLFYVAVFELEGAIAGLGGLEMNEIRLLYVSPAHQRRGIGRAILAHLEEMVPSAMFREVFVYSAMSAAGFYQSCGYFPRGKHSFLLGSQKLTTIFMTKSLREPPNTI